jgi:N-acetylglucosaminyl-diphospho-decaprenol L-rhamnosyltransferase
VSSVDVVVVAYNSRETLRACVADLQAAADLNVIVVENASPDRCLEVVEDLDVTAIRLPTNVGFSGGCNAGWRRGSAPYVLFLNPDARIDAEALSRLVEVLERVPTAGVSAPQIREVDGSLDYSQRRFLDLKSTWSQALFLHRIFPRAWWAEGMVREEQRYATVTSAEWVSGACMLVRRSALEELNGFDDGFFMYCEDMDLCQRIRNLGLDVLFEPAAVVTHEGGASAPRSALLPVLTESRIRYAEKHFTRRRAVAARLGIAVGELTHALVSSGGNATRVGHLRSFRAAVRRRAGTAGLADRTA